MGKPILNELWIINRDGLPAYHQCITEIFDETLFGGFISAILSFIEELGEENLKKMEMGGSRIVILGSADMEWLFIGRADNKVKEKKIQGYLSEVREIFFNEYGGILKTWNQDSDVFKPLDDLVDISNPETPSTLKAQESQKTRGGFL